MILFDDEDTMFDDEDKIRLFDTQQAAGKSIKHYLKVILPIVIGVVIVGSLIVYLLLPGYGEMVKAPRGLEDAIEAYYADTERRSVSDVTVYYCDNHYAAMVQLEPNSYIPGKPRDPNQPRHVIAFNREGSRWEIRASGATQSNPDDPCGQ